MANKKNSFPAKSFKLRFRTLIIFFKRISTGKNVDDCFIKYNFSIVIDFNTTSFYKLFKSSFGSTKSLKYLKGMRFLLVWLKLTWKMTEILQNYLYLRLKARTNMVKELHQPYRSLMQERKI